MTAFKPTKSLKREDSFLQKFSNRYGYRGLGAMGKIDRFEFTAKFMYISFFKIQLNEIFD
jgi:hypothetical protein